MSKSDMEILAQIGRNKHITSRLRCCNTQKAVRTASALLGLRYYVNEARNTNKSLSYNANNNYIGVHARTKRARAHECVFASQHIHLVHKIWQFASKFTFVISKRYKKWHVSFHFATHPASL